jgi:hypothetical protein
MTTDKPLAELLESLRAIFAKDMIEKPVPRKKATADPALWRAIQHQQKHGGDLFLGAVTCKGDSDKPEA